MAGPTFVPSTAGMHEMFRSVEGPLGQHLDGLVDRMVAEAVTTCPVAPPPDPVPWRHGPDRHTHKPLSTTIERSRVYPTADGLAARFGSNARHAAAVHDGARPHAIQAKYTIGRKTRHGQVHFLRFRGKRGVVVFTPAVAHPGNKPNPWLQRAADRILRG